MNAEAETLIIGGGLLGAETALALRSSGRTVRVLSRSMSPRLQAAAEGGGIELIEAEIRRGRALAAAVEGCSTVICLAGASTPAAAASDPEGALIGAVSPVLATLEAAAEAKVTRVIVPSSGGTVYGAGAAIPTPESEPLAPSSLHGVNSCVIEAFADYFAREEGLDLVVLRLSNVYGPGGESRRGQGVIAAWCRALALGQPLALIGSRSTKRDFLFSADAAAAIEAALSIEPGTYNVGGGAPVQLGELIDLLADVTGREIVVEERSGRSIDVPVTHLSIDRITSHSGWRPRTSLESGLRAVWAWENRGLGGA